MAVEVGEGFGVVGDHGIEIEGLRVGEVGIRNGNGDRGPVSGKPAAETVGVVPGAEVVVARLGVTLLALELVVVLRAGVGVRSALDPKGVEVGVVADDASVGGEHAGSAEEVLHVELGSAPSGDQCDALTGKENVFVESAA